MFTGIIQGLCPVITLSKNETLATLVVEMPGLVEGLHTGASVAINGVCLTVVSIDEVAIKFEVVNETMDRSNLSFLSSGSLVNVERSLKMGEEIGGHLVSGHVSGIVQLVEIKEDSNDVVLSFEVPRVLMKYLFKKGFVSIDGASLTIADMNRNARSISIALIPETLRATTLGLLQKGSYVNLEIDSHTMAIVDTVERISSEQAS